MKQKKIRLSYRRNKFDLNLKVCNWFGRFLGLMFTRRENARALLFEFKNPVRAPIHSFFVFFDFVAIWLDDKDKIVDLKIVTPFKFIILPKKSFSKIIEIPINRKHKEIVKIIVETRKI